MYDAVELELPLKVVVPHFLSKQGAAMKIARPRQAVSLPVDIPNLFLGFPQPQPLPAILPMPPQPLPVAENRPVPKTVETRQPVAPATAVDPGDHRTTPKEVVSRAAALNGVAGVVVALPDGLKVASQVPSDFNADTLAAFLPQIFDRVSQSAKELRMGALGNLNFTVGNVPWKIFRVNGVYFAAFGRAGGQLPDAQLAALAAELDHKK